MTDDLERRLRQALHREAERITPHERRTEILAMANDDTETAQNPRRWLIPVAAAASVALIGVAIWGVSNSGGNQQAAPATTHPVTSTTTPAAGPSTAMVPVPVPSPAPTGATTPVTLPAYFVGATTATGAPYGLYREFVRTAVPVGATAAQKAEAAVAVAMNAQPFTNYEPYVQPWSGTSVKDVAVTTDGRISDATITLSGQGASGFTAAQTRLAVQQLVWTVQAALGQGAIPVRFVVADGSPTLFGAYPTDKTYNRPAPELQYQVLAPIWITSPVRDQAFPAGATVVASGQSCAFEGTTQWQLKKGGTAVRSGSATASSGCPTRGTWKVNIGALAAGSYTFRMYEVSMQDGKIIAETSKPFSVK